MSIKCHIKNHRLLFKFYSSFTLNEWSLFWQLRSPFEKKCQNFRQNDFIVLVCGYLYSLFILTSLSSIKSLDMKSSSTDLVTGLKIKLLDLMNLYKCNITVSDFCGLGYIILSPSASFRQKIIFLLEKYFAPLQLLVI